MRAAAVQLSSTGDLDANLEAADRHTRAAARDGAELIVLPEKWPALGPPEVLEQHAQDPDDGPAVTWARHTASELGVDLVAGSMTTRTPNGNLQNVALHVGPGGEVAARYAKLHLFDVEVDGTTYRESDTEQPGDEVVVSPRLELGLAVCYDLRFPLLFEELSRRGATTIALPSAFTLPTTRDHWDVLLRARAIEQQVFVVAANQVGDHGHGLRSGGRSTIVDPWGVVLATASDRPGHVVADLDRAHQRDVRRRLPALRHRRPLAAAATA